MRIILRNFMNAQKDFMSGIPLLVCLRRAGSRAAERAEAARYHGNVHHPPPAKKIHKIAE